MSENIIVLNLGDHRNAKLNFDPTLMHTKNQQYCILQAHEFIQASSNFPIVFINDDQSEQLIPMALLGLEPQENLFYSKDGWKADFIPSSLIGYPLSTDFECKQVYIDMDSSLVSQDKGIPLYDETGQPSQLITQYLAKEQLFAKQSQETKRFISLLIEMELLKASTLSLSINGTSELSGLFTLNESKFDSLDDNSLLELKRRNYLEAIYAHRNSLNNVAKLIALKQRQ